MGRTDDDTGTVQRPRGDMSRREKVRWVRAATKRRVRGREDAAPVAVQQAAQRVDDAAHVGMARIRRALGGDRGLWVGLAGMLVVAALIMVGPVRSFLDQRDRVDLARQQLAALESANTALEARSADLTNPEHIEVLAREQLGYARPGQLAYSLVPPADDTPDVPAVEPAEEEPSWWSRLWTALTD